MQVPESLCLDSPFRIHPGSRLTDTCINLEALLLSVIVHPLLSARPMNIFLRSLRVPGELVSSAHGYADIGIVWISRVELDLSY